MSQSWQMDKMTPRPCAASVYHDAAPPAVTAATEGRWPRDAVMAATEGRWPRDGAAARRWDPHPRERVEADEGTLAPPPRGWRASASAWDELAPASVRRELRALLHARGWHADVAAGSTCHGIDAPPLGLRMWPPGAPDGPLALHVRVPADYPDSSIECDTWTCGGATAAARLHARSAAAAAGHRAAMARARHPVSLTFVAVEWERAAAVR